ncbi:MAG: AAA family ATPase, partial [Candidatus Berkelbacteria bacterium]|nr:AAA family ATPase [Candidatus Berkelbacteria bacterium]
MTDNIFDKFTSNAQSVLKEAQRLAEKDESQITTEYLLLAIINIPGTLSHDILREYSVNYDQIKLVQSLSPATPSKDNLSDHSREVLKLSFRLASNFGHFNVDVEHVLIALLSSREFGCYKTIQKIGINPEQIRRQLETIFNDLAEMDQMIKNQPMPPRFPPQLDQQAAPEPFETPVFRQEPFAPVREMNPTAVKQKVLEYFATNIVEKAKKKELDPIIGRENEISRAIQILLRKRKNNPVFIGDPGVGKTAIVEGLAQKIADGNVPERLKKRKIYQLDMGLLVAGTMYRGQFEDRLKKVLSEVKEDKSIILFIDEVHSIVGTGSAEGSMDAANILKPALSKGEIRLIGATTFDDYRKFIEKDSALERRLQPIVVSEPTVEETIDILRGIKSVYEDHHQIKVEEAALIGAATLSKK